MTTKFKPGDRVANKDGTPFSNGQKVVTVDYIDEDGRVWLKETKSYYRPDHADYAIEFANPCKSISLDGDSSAYYQLPPDAKELGDLIEHKKMNFNVGNIFKASYRLGEKPGTDELYDLNKIVWFANREINRIKRSQFTDVHKKEAV